MSFHLRLATFVFLFHCSVFSELLRNDTDKTLSTAYERAEKMYADNNPIASTKLYWNLYDKDEQGRITVLGKLSNLYRQSNRTTDFVDLLENNLAKRPFEYALNKQLAFEYFSAGQTEKALERIQVALADAKAEASGYNLAGEIYLSSKKFEDCVYYSSRALQEKHNSAMLLLRAECFLNLKNVKNTQADLDAYLKEEPATQKTYNLQDLVYVLSGDSKKMEKNLQQCIAQIPDSEDCFSGYLKKFGLKNYNWSSQYFETYMSAFMKSPVVLTEMAKIYSLYPRPPTENVLLKLIELKPTEYVYYKQLFEYYKKTKQTQKAFDLMQSYLAQNPQSKEAKGDQESLFLNKVPQKIPLTEVIADKNKMSNSIAVSSSKSKAQELYESGRYEESLRIVKSIKPRGSKEYFRVANIMYQLKNYKLARTNWAYVSKQSSLYEDAVLNTAIAFRMQGMKEESEKIIRETDFSTDYKFKAEIIVNLLAKEKNLTESELQDINTQYRNLINLEWGAE